VRRALAAAGIALAVAAAPASAAQRSGASLHDARYCEILELRGAPPDATVTVWNTIGLNKCPPKWWRGFDAATLARQRGDTFVVLNGPRHFLMDAATATTGRVRRFHGMRMRQVATIRIRTAADLAQAPYVDRTITRANTWRWNAGRAVFELVAPGGDTYVMQSYAQIKDPRLTLANLPGLARRLKLPPGWHYRARKLKQPLILSARGNATILQDDLEDTYQLATTVRRGKRSRHDVSMAGRTHTVTPATPGTVEDHGTVSGTPFGKGRVVLVGVFANSRLTATFRLTFPRGSIIGATSMPFTITGNEIDFKGTSRFTGGTGIYRGITSGALPTHDHNTLDGQNGSLTVGGVAKY
jgi:hypothetical protein